MPDDLIQCDAIAFNTHNFFVPMKIKSHRNLAIEEKNGTSSDLPTEHLLTTLHAETYIRFVRFGECHLVAKL